jgi:hypothetical protein
LNCEFSSENEYQVIGKVYRCDSKNLSTTTEDDTVTETSGDHETGKDDTDVRLLKIEQQNIPRLPKNLNKFFPDLVGLIIDSSNLRVISKHDLSAFSKLNILFIGHNRIENLDADTFEETPDIEWLVFTDNFTKRISDDVLKSLSKLNFANFLRNTYINRKAVNGHEIELLKEEIKVKC